MSSSPTTTSTTTPSAEPSRRALPRSPSGCDGDHAACERVRMDAVPRRGAGTRRVAGSSGACWILCRDLVLQARRLSTPHIFCRLALQTPQLLQGRYRFLFLSARGVFTTLLHIHGPVQAEGLLSVDVRHRGFILEPTLSSELRFCFY